MLFRGLPNILPLDNATDPAEDQGAAGLRVLAGNVQIIQTIWMFSAHPKCIATRNKCLTSSNKKLLGTRSY